VADPAHAGTGPLQAAAGLDRIAVVQPDEGTEDISAWDVPLGALPWLLPPATAGRDENRREEVSSLAPQVAPGELLPPAESVPEPAPEPGSPALATWRRVKGDPTGTPAPKEYLTLDRPVCGGPTYTPEQLAAMEAEDEEAARREAEQEEAEAAKERTAIELLKQDDTAWNSRGPRGGDAALG
jgi:hypothetical protein